MDKRLAISLPLACESLVVPPPALGQSKASLLELFCLLELPFYQVAQIRRPTAPHGFRAAMMWAL